MVNKNTSNEEGRLISIPDTFETWTEKAMAGLGVFSLSYVIHNFALEDQISFIKFITIIFLIFIVAVIYLCVKDLLVPKINYVYDHNDFLKIEHKKNKHKLYFVDIVKLKYAKEENEVTLNLKQPLFAKKIRFNIAKDKNNILKNSLNKRIEEAKQP